jgi:hypothetical protein
VECVGSSGTTIDLIYNLQIGTQLCKAYTPLRSGRLCILSTFAGSLLLCRKLGTTDTANTDGQVAVWFSAPKACWGRESG